MTADKIPDGKCNKCGQDLFRYRTERHGLMITMPEVHELSDCIRFLAERIRLLELFK